jgi:S1-C subfamily serine protease
MAHTIDDFLSRNQDHQIVVIAGSGHIIYGSGIPKRTFRLNQKEYVTLVNAKAGNPVEGIADYVLFPEPLTAPSSPRLGIYIDEKDNAVTIKEFSRGSVAKNAGMKKGDQLLSVDGIKVTGFEDLQIALFDKKGNDTITVTVLRKVFLFPDKELAFEIKLKEPFSHP